MSSERIIKDKENLNLIAKSDLTKKSIVEPLGEKKLVDQNKKDIDEDDRLT